MRLASTLVALGMIAGCNAYSPGSFVVENRPFSGTRATVGCLDLSAYRRADHGQAAVLEYHFGNRCDHSATVDLAYAPVVGRTRDGREVTLAPYDPGKTLLALELSARAGGHEALAYLTENDEPIAQICVDVAAIAHRQPAQWLCFARSEDDVAAPPAEPSEPTEPLAPTAAAYPISSEVTP
ncbi:MAG TPA: hypothetical protein VFQ53_09130 [Kofleriaceae bacterium]|nr:hypothetical protein [Kofleriaceae bacterium]